MDYMETKGCGGGWLFAKKIGSNGNLCIFQNVEEEDFQRALVLSFGKAGWYLWGRQVNIMKPRSYKVFANKHFAWKFRLWNIGNNNSRIHFYITYCLLNGLYLFLSCASLRYTIMMLGKRNGRQSLAEDYIGAFEIYGNVFWSRFFSFSTLIQRRKILKTSSCLVYSNLD